MKDDKKKLIVFGGLIVVILGVGVFQLTSGGGKPAPAPKSKVTAKLDPQAEEVKTPEVTTFGPDGQPIEVPVQPGTETLVATNHGLRDPFDGGTLMRASSNDRGQAPKPAPIQKPMQTQTPRPSTIGGRIDPGYQPMDVNALPGPDGKPGGTSITPGDKIPLPDDFNYTLSGLITGERPAAVFRDSSGNQQLIQLGGSLGPETKVIKIGNGRVTVRHRGKTKILSVGGDAAAGGDSK